MSLSASETVANEGASMPAWRRLIESRYVVGGGYVVAALLTITGALLVSSPPAVGPIGPAVQAMLVVLGLNLILILGLAALVTLRVFRLLRERESDAGARLHLRFMALFGTAAVAPAIIVAIFFGGFVLTGVETWFGRKISTLVENSATTARSVVQEQTQILSDNMMLVTGDLNEAAGALQSTPVAYAHYLAQVSSGAFSAVYVLDRDGRVLARAEKPNAPAFVAPPAASYRAADEEDISAQTFESENVIRALYRLKAYPDPDPYLYVVRPVGTGILSQLREAEAALVALREAPTTASGSRALSCSPTSRRPCWCWWAPPGWPSPRRTRSPRLSPAWCRRPARWPPAISTPGWTREINLKKWPYCRGLSTA